VLDVGCGPGAITRGIAEAVGSEGRVVGVDTDTTLIETARRDHAGIDNLVFQVADALALPFDRRFDVVTAARTLQWVADPKTGIAHLCKAVKPG
jgi:ubiquinone/menaquinone biosynthesis C-methylase UbiE